MSNTMLHPGIYVQEMKSEKRTVRTVSTSTAGFVGVTQKGEIGKARLVTNWTQFVKEYGGYMKDSYLAYSVRQFFENGGNRAYITRTVHSDLGVNASSKATVNIQDELLSSTAFTVTAKTDGTHGNNIIINVKSFVESGKVITLEVLEKGVLLESYVGSLTDLDEIVNIDSDYIVVEVLDDSLKPKVSSVNLAGGTDGLVGLVDTDFIGNKEQGNGMYSFDNIKINMLVIPGQSSSAVHSAMIEYTEGRKDCVCILDAPIGKSPKEMVKFREGMNSNSEYSNLYYPWVQISDPIGVGKNPTKLLPPSGIMAGIYARTDSSRGVHKAPAGVELNLLGIIGLEYNVSDEEHDLLNPIGVNCIKAISQRGIVPFGARTMSDDSEMKYINIRRHVIHVEQSLKELLHWTVFENNDKKLWDKIISVASSFLRSEWKVGAFKGSAEEEAFYVKCDEEVNTPESVDAGKLYVDIGVAEQKPAEFVVLRVALK